MRDGSGPAAVSPWRLSWYSRTARRQSSTSEVDIRCYDKAAIVRNVQRNRATYNDHEVALSVRVNQVWVNQQGQWRLAGIQLSPLDQSEA
jgi:hypothetical protein